MPKKGQKKGKGIFDGFDVPAFDTSFQGIPVGEVNQGFDMGFSQEFRDDDVLGNDPRAPELVSENFDEPADMFDIENTFRQEVGSEIRFNQPKIPKVTESLGNIMGIGRRKKQEINVNVKRVPLTDDDAIEEEVIVEEVPRRRKKQRFRNEFEDIRFEQLQGGGAPLNEQEQVNFSQGRTFRGES